ncbi:MAG: TlpA disulfide reductase family protein [Myxococcota bacterium]
MQDETAQQEDKASFWERMVRYVVLGGALLMVAIMASQGTQTLPTGTTAPPLSIWDTAGDPVDLAPYRGRPLLLNFWATWCGPCVSEIPELNRAHEALGKEVNIVGVMVMSGGPQEAKTGAQRLGIRYPVWVADDATAQRWQVSAVPTSFLIDGAGKVRWTANGTVDEDDIRDALQSLRQEK